MNGDAFPDDLPVRSLCRRMVCTVCGMIGADVRPVEARIRAGRKWTPRQQLKERAGAFLLDRRGAASRTTRIEGCRPNYTGLRSPFRHLTGVA
jgi:hypothetical protein